MLFSTEAYYDERLRRERSPLTEFHFMKAIRLLQDRLSDPDSPQAISDQTMMTVVILAMAADFIDDQASVENHVRGLQRMVGLRGGLTTMRSAAVGDLQAKICRCVKADVPSRWKLTA
jgi:hypothetical protein